MADPKPPARVRLSPAKYALLSKLVMVKQDGKCACGCGRKAESIHHVVGGTHRSDVRENMVGLNGDGVRGCHGAFTSKRRVHDWYRGNDDVIEPENVAYGIRAYLETERRDVLEYVLSVKGRDWLDLHYPEWPQQDAA